MGFVYSAIRSSTRAGGHVSDKQVFSWDSTRDLTLSVQGSMSEVDPRTEKVTGLAKSHARSHHLFHFGLPEVVFVNRLSSPES